MKKVFSWLLAMVMVFLVLPMSAVADATSIEQESLSINNNAYSMGKIPSEVARVTKYDPEWAFMHHPAGIVYFKDKYYTAFSRGEWGEDFPGQQMAMSVSDDFYNWSDPTVIFPAPQGTYGQTCVIPVGFYVFQDTLIANVYVHDYGEKFFNEDGSFNPTGGGTVTTTIQQIYTTDGVNWSSPRQINSVYTLAYPRPISTGGWFSCNGKWMHYTDDKNPSGLTAWNWTVMSTEQITNSHNRNGGKALTEGSWYEGPDGVLHSMIRSDSGYLFHAASYDGGKTMTEFYPTNFSSDNTQFNFWNLSDGRALGIGTPNEDENIWGMWPLNLYVSEDGYNFDTVYTVRDEWYTLEQQGYSKGGQYAYMKMMELDGYLYIFYSRMKEVMEITRLKISDIKTANDELREVVPEVVDGPLLADFTTRTKYNAAVNSGKVGVGNPNNASFAYEDGAVKLTYLNGNPVNDTRRGETQLMIHPMINKAVDKNQIVVVKMKADTTGYDGGFLGYGDRVMVGDTEINSAGATATNHPIKAGAGDWVLEGKDGWLYVAFTSKEAIADVSANANWGRLDIWGQGVSYQTGESIYVEWVGTFDSLEDAKTWDVTFQESLEGIIDPPNVSPFFIDFSDGLHDQKGTAPYIVIEGNTAVSYDKEVGAMKIGTSTLKDSNMNTNATFNIGKVQYWPGEVNVSTKDYPIFAIKYKTLKTDVVPVASSILLRDEAFKTWKYPTVVSDTAPYAYDATDTDWQLLLFDVSEIDDPTKWTLFITPMVEPWSNEYGATQNPALWDGVPEDLGYIAWAGAFGSVADAQRYFDEVGHTYDSLCDATCNDCDHVRETTTEHTYDNDCDADCNKCSAVREVADHQYDNGLDVDCNECGTTREVTFTGWWKADGNWYYYKNGALLKNQWQLDSVGWCYLGADGAMKTNAWVKDSHGWCYVGKDGYIVKSDWVKDGGKWYYLNKEGYMLSNTWQQDSKGWCYLGADGAMKTNAWVKDSVGWCYVGADGYCVTNAWKKDSVGWVYLDHNGRMLTNAWVRDSVGWCYVGADGYAVTDCWKKDSVGWCYLNSEGSMVKNDWVKDGGKWYYLDANGYMLADTTKTIGGIKYTFNASGVWVG